MNLSIFLNNSPILLILYYKYHKNILNNFYISNLK